MADRFIFHGRISESQEDLLRYGQFCGESQDDGVSEDSSGSDEDIQVASTGIMICSPPITQVEEVEEFHTPEEQERIEELDSNVGGVLKDCDGHGVGGSSEIERGKENSPSMGDLGIGKSKSVGLGPECIESAYMEEGNQGEVLKFKGNLFSASTNSALNTRKTVTPLAPTIENDNNDEAFDVEIHVEDHLVGESQGAVNGCVTATELMGSDMLGVNDDHSETMKNVASGDTLLEKVIGQDVLPFEGSKELQLDPQTSVVNNVAGVERDFSLRNAGELRKLPNWDRGVTRDVSTRRVGSEGSSAHEGGMIRTRAEDKDGNGEPKEDSSSSFPIEKSGNRVIEDGNNLPLEMGAPKGNSSRPSTVEKSTISRVIEDCGSLPPEVVSFLLEATGSTLPKEVDEWLKTADILEVAQRKGLVLPRPRWWRSDGYGKL